MFADRWEYAFALEARTAFHVGTGEFLTIPTKGTGNEGGEIALIVRDHEGKPYLPSTALKGALKAVGRAAGIEEPLLQALFGTVKDKKIEGNIGLLLLHGGTLASGARVDVTAMPYADTLAEAGRHHAFVAARTAIDGATGTAADHKLFFQEMAPAELRFDIRATLLDHGSRANDARDVWRKIVGIVLRDGLFLGKSRADGQGQFAIATGKVMETRRELVSDGTLRATSPERFDAVADQATDAALHIFSLHCATPFLVVDSARKGAGKETSKQVGGAQVFPQRTARTTPLVLGSTIAGALRARATWLSRLMALRDEVARDDADEAIVWLFGKTASQARLAIRDLKVAAGQVEAVTSVKIDRFSGAPVHGALFTTEAFTGVNLGFSLHLKRRKASNAVAEQILDRLVADIRVNGLRLGHGTNKGFGWFEPKPERKAAHGAR